MPAKIDCGVKVGRSTNQSIPSGSATPVQFDTEIYDTHGFWTAGAPTKLTVPTGEGGLYIIGGNNVFSTSVAAYSRISIVKGGSTTLKQDGQYGLTADRGDCTCGMAYLQAGEWIESWAYHTGSGAQTLYGATVYPSFWAQRLGRYNEAGNWDLGRTAQGVRVYHNTTQGIPDSTWTTISFNSERFDTADYHSTTVNPDRITIPVGQDGTYLVGACVAIESVNNGYYIALLLNGGNIAQVTHHYAIVNNRIGLPEVVLRLSAGNYLTTRVWHSTGAERSTFAGTAPYLQDFWAVRLF